MASRRDTDVTKYLAFLRAINVAGHACVRMSDLKAAFVAAGCQEVRTYIQSGNVLFDLPEPNPTEVFDRVRGQLTHLLGAEPGVLFRTVRQVERIVTGTPFKDFEAEPDVKLYVTFLSERPHGKPALPLQSSKEALEVVAIKNLEAFIVSRRKPNGSYGFPNHFIEQELGVSATSRNWSTVTKIVDFARRESDS